MPFGLQPGHVILILFVILLIFGPARLSNYGHSLAKNFGEFIKGFKETQKTPHTEINHVERNDDHGSQVSGQVVCSYCGAANPPLSRFCMKCGINLTR